MWTLKALPQVRQESNWWHNKSNIIGGRRETHDLEETGKKKPIVSYNVSDVTTNK